MSKSLGLAAALVLAVPAPCWAQSNERQPHQGTTDGSQSGSVQFNPTGMSIVVVKGSGLPVSGGSTFIDQPSTVQCLSTSGCTITVASFAVLSENPQWFEICSLVDGQNISPSCLKDYESTNREATFYSGMQSSLSVAQGPHTIQSEVIIHGDYNLILDRWQFVYTLYDH